MKPYPMMTYFVPVGRMADYAHPAPDVTAYRPATQLFGDNICRVFHSRAAMLAACQSSADAELWQPRWVPLMKRGIGEQLSPLALIPASQVQS